MLLTAKEAAGIIGCNPETIRRWCRDGKIAARISNKKNGWLIDDSELEKKHRWYHLNEPDATHTRLKVLRCKIRRSIADVSGDIGIDPGTYRRYECNKAVIPSKVIVKLALYYGVTTDYLLCMDQYEEGIQNG